MSILRKNNNIFLYTIFTIEERLMNVLKEILEEIQEGRTIFNPISQSSVEMKNFQPIAKILLFAHKEGLIEGFAEHKESETAYNLYDFVLVKGGLSYQGEKYLQNIEDENTEKINKIIQLKPSIYGVEIDIIALWKHFKNH